MGGHTVWVIYPRTRYMPVQSRPILRLSTARNSPFDTNVVSSLTIYLTHFTPSFHPWKVRLSIIGRRNQHPLTGRASHEGLDPL